MAGDNDTVLVSNGVFLITATIVVDSGFTLEGVNGPGATTVERDGAEPDFWIVTVNHANALVAGLTVRNGQESRTPDYTYAENPTGIWVTNGIVSNCVVTANIKGTGLKIEGSGVATHCLLQLPEDRL